MSINPIILLAVFIMAPLTLSSVYAQAPAQFITPDQTNSDLSHNLTSPYVVRSEPISVRESALESDFITATLFGETYTISNEKRITRSFGYDVWIGSGDGVQALFIINGSNIDGTLDTTYNTYSITSSDEASIATELDLSSLPPESSSPELVSGQEHDEPYMEKIERLADAYIGNMDYTKDAITIDVYVGYTPHARDVYRIDLHSTIRTGIMQAIEHANMAYDENELPIEVNLVGMDDTGYPGGDLQDDLKKLINPTIRNFQHFEDQAIDKNADIILLIGNYTKNRADERMLDERMSDEHMSDPSQNDLRKYGGGEGDCGKAQATLARNIGSSYGVVSAICLPGYSLTYVIGALQGASPNIDHKDTPSRLGTRTTNSEFYYGHGSYLPARDSNGQRTIMAQNHPSCDDPADDDEILICKRQRMWSDPYREFFGTNKNAGTVLDQWNARVLFATAPHIASFRGGAESYDAVNPTGTISVSPSGTLSRGQTITVTATFDESIHPKYLPYLTFTDGYGSVTGVMTRISETVFTYTHRTTNSGTFDMLLSNARDMYGNPVNPIPASTESIRVAERGTPPVIAPPPSNALFKLNEFFSNNNRWIDTIEPYWVIKNPYDTIPYYQIGGNKVLSSSACDRTCIITLGTPLDTTLPLGISLDLFVAKKAGGSDGLRLQYSTDGIRWNTLVAYLGSGGYDTGIWTPISIGLNIPESSAQLRLVANSRDAMDVVEVDNLRIFRPAHADPPVTFNPLLVEAKDRIILSFDGSTSSFRPTASDFELSHGSISRISDTSGRTFTLFVRDIPYGTAVTVTYTGHPEELGGRTLSRNTAASTNAVGNPVPPLLIAQPESILAEATGVRTPVELDEPMISGGVLPYTITNDAPSSFELGRTIITWTVTDSVGNDAMAVQTVTVRDTTNPIFAGTPPDIMISSIVPVPVTFDAPVATDIFPVRVSCMPDSGHTFLIKATEVMCTATDSSDNTAEISFRVVIADADIIPPVITAPADMTFEATGKLTPLNHTQYGTATATDDRDPNPAITSDAPASFELGRTIIIWTGTDSAGNNSTSMQTITVQDTTPPEFDDASLLLFPLEIGRSDTSLSDAVPAASDLVDGIITPECEPDPAGRFGSGAHTLTCTATDESDNRINATRTIIIHEGQTPRMQGIGDSGVAFAGGDYIHIMFDKIYGKPGYKCIIWTDDYDARTITFTDMPPCSFHSLEPETAYAVNVVPRGAGEKAIFPYTEVSTGPPFNYVNIVDGFESLEGWQLFNDWDTRVNVKTYNISIANDTGMPPPSAVIHGDGYPLWAGLEKTVSLDNHTAGDPLYLKFDHRGTSNSYSYLISNAMLYIADESGWSLYTKLLVAGRTPDTGWNSYSADISNIVGNSSSIRLWLFLTDLWDHDFEQRTYFDNFYLSSIPPPSSGAAGEAEHTITYEQLSEFLDETGAVCALYPDVSLQPLIDRYIVENDLDVQCG